jgi:hypothetical protein
VPLQKKQSLCLKQKKIGLTIHCIGHLIYSILTVFGEKLILLKIFFFIGIFNSLYFLVWRQANLNLALLNFMIGMRLLHVPSALACVKLHALANATESPN